MLPDEDPSPAIVSLLVTLKKLVNGRMVVKPVHVFLLTSKVCCKYMAVEKNEKDLLRHFCGIIVGIRKIFITHYKVNLKPGPIW